MLLLPSLLVATLLLSITLTGLLRRYGQTRLLDQPNHRSSHHIPTPRGGGMAIVSAFLLAAPWLVASMPNAHPLPVPVADLALIWLAALLVALIGFIDDHHSLAPKPRLIVQSLAAAMVVSAVNGLPALTLFGWQLELAWVGYLLAWLGVIWFINLYNFMDGIDGLAAGQAVTVCLAMALIHYIDGLAGLDGLAALDGVNGPAGLAARDGVNGLAGSQWSSTALVLLLAAAAAGFLCWNFPPARIFMGDGGSGFLGIMLASLMLLDAKQQPAYLWAWLVMLGVFVVDATWTLLNRYRRHCRLSDAHRTHAYQYAARRCGSHRTVTLTVLLINCLWLAPISVMIVSGYIDGLLGLCIAYLPLACLAYHLKAGVPD